MNGVLDPRSPAAELSSQNTPSAFSSSRDNGSLAHGSHQPMSQAYSVNTTLMSSRLTWVENRSR